MVDAHELEELIAKFQDKKRLVNAISNSFENTLEKQQTYTVKNTRFKSGTGATLGAMEHEVTGLNGSIFVDKAKIPYIEPVYFGSGIYGEKKKPIEITPKNKEALSWVSGNSRFFSKGHTIKGQKPNPFIETAYNKNLNNFLKWYSDDLTEQIEDAL